MSIQAVARSWGRAFVTQFHPRMLWLTCLPFLLAFILWAVALWFGLQALIDVLQNWTLQNPDFSSWVSWASLLGMLAMKALVVPFLAMWLLLPLVVISALVFTTLLAMPAINKHVGQRHYAGLVCKEGGTLLGSLVHASSTVLLFAVLWLLCLPLVFLPPLNLLVQPVLWGWLTYRIMTYDALSLHADEDERAAILRQHRYPLLLIGIIAGLAGAMPGLMWLGGVAAMMFLPVLASIAVFIYVLVFIFSALWFQFYCLDALQAMRQSGAASETL